MKFSKFYVDHFGKLKNTAVNLSDGINVISGYNESGKSTLHSFVSAMIFGLERGRGRAAKNDDYTKYTPWDGGTYGGKIEVVRGEETFSISRNFTKDISCVAVVNETKHMEESDEKLPEIFPGLSPSSYNNTISVKQLSASTGSELADELKNHIINLRTAGAYNLDVAGAVNRLKLQKKKVMAAYSKDAAYEAEELETRTALIEADLDKDDPGLSLPSLEKKKKDLDKKISDINLKKDELRKKVSDNSDILRANHIANESDANEIYNEVSSYSDYVDEFAKRHSFSVKPFAKKLFVLLTILGLIMLFGGLGAFIYSTVYGFMTNLKLVFAVASAIGFIITLIFIIKQSSLSSFRKACQKIEKLYIELTGKEPEGIGMAEIEELRQKPELFKKAIDEIKEDKIKFENLANEETLAKNELTKIDSNLEIAKKFAWSREQKEDALSSLRLRLDMLKESLNKNKKIEEESAAIDLAISTIETISKDVFDSFGHFLEDTTSALLKSMTDGSYSGVVINDSFDISLVQGERKVELSSVSGGTLDQVYLALRLACIEFMWPDEAMPLLLDDTFAMYDRNRLACTLSWLSENYSGQIIIFTCHERETDILNNLNIPYNLAEL